MKYLFAAALAAASVAHAQTNWKLATGYRAESFHTQNVYKFAQDVEQATSGQLRIDVHPNNTLFKLNDIRQAVHDGKAQAGETIMKSMVKDIPIAGADAIPFVVGSYEDARRMWELQRPLIDRHFAGRGLKALYAVPWPPPGPVRRCARAFICGLQGHAHAHLQHLFEHFPHIFLGQVKLPSVTGNCCFGDYVPLL